MENYKWKIVKTIKNFRNLKDISFEFIKGGITIMVGENNIGKTNLLDYIYEENEDWDQFELEENDYETEFFQEINQRLPSYRKNKDIIDLFFPSWDRYQGNINVIFHHSNYIYKNLKTEGIMELSYKIYYFDLTASTSFLTKKGKEKFKLEKVKSRSCELIYGKELKYNSQEKTVQQENDRIHDHFIMETDKEKLEKTDPWTPVYKTEEKNFVRHEEDNIISYRGFHKDICHSLGKLGSGYLKYKTIESLVENIGRGHIIDNGNMLRPTHFPIKVQSTILLIDEPEVFLHPSLIASLAILIKKAEKNGITVILTTHSPEFIYHFIDENLTTNLVIAQKEREGNNKGYLSLLYLWKLIDKIKEKVKSEYEKYAKESEKNEGKFTDASYINKWKVLLSNKEILKLLFSKKILFVEGPVECILFKSILRKETEGIGIVPIFGKFHYIFLANLVAELGVKYWFIIDDDRKKNSSKPGEVEWVNEEAGWFWKDYSGDIDNEKNNGILHTKDTKISWVHFNIEEFLEIPVKGRNKEYNIISRANKVKSEKLKLLKEIFSFLNNND